MKAPYELKGMKEKRVLVLGGLGFIGSGIALKCAELGAKVTVFDAMLEPYGFNHANISEIRDKVEFLKQDMRDLDALSKAVKEKDIVFNCAGQVSHIDSMKNPFLDVELNVTANLNLLEACRKFNDGVKIIYAATRSQTGKPIYIPVDEKHPDNPLDVYGADKLAAEKHVLLYNSFYGLKGTSIRINTTFGPRHQMKHNLYGVLNWFIRLAMENKKITVYGNGNQLREYNYIDDVVDAMVLAAQNNNSNGNYYMLGVKKPIKFVEMVKKVIQECGSGSFEMVPYPADRKSIEVGDFNVSFEKIKSDLGWVPTTSFEDGLKKTVEFYRNNKKHYF